MTDLWYPDGWGLHRAYVAPDYARMGLAVYLVQRRGDRASVAVPSVLEFREVDEVIVQEPTFRMPDGMARALLDALATYFGGTGEVQTLRKDYLAERARVDKVLDFLTQRYPSPRPETIADRLGYPS